MKKIVPIAVIVIVIAFLALSCKVIDTGSEAQYTGVVEFDASASSGEDWEHVVAEITEKAQDIASVDTGALGTGTAVRFKGTVTEYVSKAKGKKDSLTVAPEGYTGEAVISVFIGSATSDTSVRDTQTIKAFGDFTNQTEWSEYAKALNTELYNGVVTPAAFAEDTAAGKTITVIGVATLDGDKVNIMPISITVE